MRWRTTARVRHAARGRGREDFSLFHPKRGGQSEWALTAPYLLFLLILMVKLSRFAQQFAVGYQNHSTDDIQDFLVKLDGTDADGTFCRPGLKGSVKGVYISATMRQPFQFSPLEITGEWFL